MTWAADLSSWATSQRVAGLSPNTIKLRLEYLRRLAAWAGDRDPWALTVDDLTEWIGAQKWGNATVLTVQGSLRAFYAWAALTGRSAANPARHLPRVRKPQPRPRPVLDAGYQVALESPDPRVRLMVRIAGDLGLRRAEVSQIHRDHIVDTPDGYLLRVLGKGDKERHVPISDALAADLRAAADLQTGYLFPGGDHGHLSANRVGVLVSTALPDGYSMHKLRHRALTRAYRHSKDILLTAALAGHSSVATTQAYYVAVDEAALRSLVEGIAS